MTADAMDIWGDIYRDHNRGLKVPHTIIRDDGHRETFEDAGIYFSAPRSPDQADALAGMKGVVLDAACGPGSYSLYLQERGAKVVAVDSSEGAIEVCRERGCHDARVMDMRTLTLEPGTFDAVLLMGKTLGLGQTPSEQAALFRKLHEATKATGVIVGTSIDPRQTEDPVHLAYHEQNRRAGRPIGMVRIRLDYGERHGPWFYVWMMTPREVEDTASKAGWRIRSSEQTSPTCLYVLEKS